MATLLDLVVAFRTSCVTFKTLAPQPITHDDIFVGNHAVVCRCVDSGSGELISLKCYPHRRRNSSAIYGMAYLPDDAQIHSLRGVETFDVVALPWIEGSSHDKLFRNPKSDYRRLSRAFDTMAYGMLCAPRAHGDIKPGNIIVAPTGEMHLIDYDAAWVPGFTERDIEEVGTPAFSHPQRNGRCFDKGIDDFSIALISIMLAAMAHRRNEFEPHLKGDDSLFCPRDVLTDDDALLKVAIRTFERKHDMAHYHIARSLYGCDGRIDGLQDALLAAIKR